MDPKRDSLDPRSAWIFRLEHERNRELFGFLWVCSQLDCRKRKRRDSWQFRAGSVISIELRLPNVERYRGKLQLRGWHMKGLLALLLISGTAAFVNAAQSTPPKQSNQPFSITITPPGTDVKAGTVVYVIIRLTNTSTSQNNNLDGQGMYDMNGVDMSYRYDCKDASGKPVAKEFSGIIGSAGDRPALPPGESREETVPVSRACDLSRPGRNTIQVSRIDQSDPKHRAISSNRITIIVTK